MTHTELIYPTLLKCCEFNVDSFWKFIFEDLAYARPPYGTFIVKDFICCNYKNKEFSYKIDEEKDPQVLYNEIYDLLANKFGLMSDEDKKIKRIEFEQTQADFHENMCENWNSIKKKNIKQNLIENFVINMKKKHKLNKKNVKKLLSLICIGIMFKTIGNNDIEYSPGEILSIDNIDFKQNKIILNKNFLKCEISKENPVNTDPPKISNHWEKYINSIVNKKL